MTEYFCPISHTCPHWLEVCRERGCQHPEAVEMRAALLQPGHITFLPGPSGYTHDGIDRWPGPRRFIVWGACIGLAALALPAAVALLLGVVGTLMGLR